MFFFFTFIKSISINHYTKIIIQSLPMRSVLIRHSCFKSLPRTKHSCKISTISLSSSTLQFRHGTFSFSLSNNTRLRAESPNISPLPSIQNPDKIDRNSDNIILRFLGIQQLTVAGTTLVLSCVLAIIASCGSKTRNHIAIAGPREIYQKAPPNRDQMNPMGGKAALKSLLDVTASLASGKVDPVVKSPAFYLPARPSRVEIDKVKLEAVRQMKLGKAEEAVLILRRAYNNYRNDPEPAYYVEMALVEILICQGKYKEASECNCLNEDHNIISDDRISLYKAIICTMLDKKDEAKQHWEEFAEAVAEGHDFN